MVHGKETPLHPKETSYVTNHNWVCRVLPSQRPHPIGIPMAFKKKIAVLFQIENHLSEATSREDYEQSAEYGVSCLGNRQDEEMIH